MNGQELERSVLDGFCCRKRPSWSDDWTEVVVAHVDDRSVEHVRVQERFRPKRCLVDCKVCLQVHAVSLAEAESRGKMQMTTAGCAQRVKSKMAPVSSLQKSQPGEASDLDSFLPSACIIFINKCSNNPPSLAHLAILTLHV